MCVGARAHVHVHGFTSVQIQTRNLNKTLNNLLTQDRIIHPGNGDFFNLSCLDKLRGWTSHTTSRSHTLLYEITSSSYLPEVERTERLIKEGASINKIKGSLC